MRYSLHQRPARRALPVRVLAAVGAAGLALASGACLDKGLTDDPLTDSEVAAFFSQAAQTKADAATAGIAAALDAAGAQRSAIQGAYDAKVAAELLAQARDAATQKLTDLQPRVDALAGRTTQEESDALTQARADVDTDMDGTDPDAIASSVSAYEQVIADTETSVAAREAAANRPVTGGGASTGGYVGTGQPQIGAGTGTAGGGTHDDSATAGGSVTDPGGTSDGGQEVPPPPIDEPDDQPGGNGGGDNGGGEGPVDAGDGTPDQPSD